MAEERTLGLARAYDQTAEEPSKQELQRRLDEARDSISHTVTEIKESVASQVQAVKESLDWREQVKKRPVAWSAGAMGVGFLVGYGLAAMAKGDGGDSASAYSSNMDRYYAGEYDAGEAKRSYAAQPILHAPASEPYKQGNGKHDDGPGFFEKLTTTPAYHKVKHEAGNIGDAVMHELTNTAKTVVLPALMTSLRNFIGGYLPNAQSTGGTQPSPTSSSMRSETDRARSGTGPTYQPTLEREV
jgi:hypothetical protein